MKIALPLACLLALSAPLDSLARDLTSDAPEMIGDPTTGDSDVNATPSSRLPPNATASGAAAPVEIARVHFQRGVALYRSGAYDAALAEFTRAHESAPHFRILYNLAQVQAQRHDYVEALDFFQRYLTEGAGNVPASRVEEVRAEMAELEQRIARLRVETNVDDVRLFVNDLPAIELPRDEPLLLNAGIHRLRLEKPGYVTTTRSVTLAGGEESTINLDLLAELEIDDVSISLPPSPPRPAPPLVVDRTALWSSLAATGALTGATVTFGFLTRRANATLGDRLARYPAPRASVESGRDRVRTFALLTDSFGMAAATALGLSTYFYFSTDETSDESTPYTGLGAQIGPRASSVSWSGSF